jgi:uroporphyrinogen-III synthase
LTITRVLVLRPQPSASATVERARAAGLDAFAVPLFRIEPVAWRAPDARAFDGLLLTSANAVEHGGADLHHLHGLNVYAVGETTAAAARHAGFDVAAVGDAGVDRLLGSLDPALKLLHLSGADRRAPANAAQEITQLVTYRAEAIDDPDLSDIGGSVALIHSPRAGRRFAELVSRRDAIAIAAISAAAAHAVGDGWNSVAAADRPTEDALLALASSLCNNSPLE